MFKNFHNSLNSLD